ncbi:MAG: hypothetical protein R3B13_02890 [Polyangiaceae bacterium]
MQLSIRFINIKPSLHVWKHAERRLKAALGRIAPALGRVTLRLSDQNGPRGGVDMLCRVTVKLRNGKALAVDAQAAGSLPAIDRAAGRVSRAVLRELGRGRRRSNRRIVGQLVTAGLG